MESPLMRRKRRRSTPLLPTVVARQLKSSNWWTPLVFTLSALLCLAWLSLQYGAKLDQDHAFIHEIVTESVTRTSDGNATTTIRQEQRTSVTTRRDTQGTQTNPDSLRDWLTGTVKPQKMDPSANLQNLALQNQEDPTYVVSRAVVQASASGTGLMNKYYYRFDNVQLSRDKITVYYDPESFTPPTRPLWVDIISGNVSTPNYPTMFLLKGDLHNTPWFYLPVEYVPATEHQPKCSMWVHQVGYILQVRYSYNIWHTWNEGLMGIFQSLRELGQLPLASIGPNGEMEEITDGMGGEGCPYAYHPELKRVVQEASCSPRSGLLDRTHCNPTTEKWCRPGAVVSIRRDGGGPVIIPYTASSVMNVWAHLYRSMTTDVRDWSEIEGACFKNLIVGKSSTLNFYQAVNSTMPDKFAINRYSRINMLENRVEAMAVFKQFMYSAQKEHIADEESKGAEAWQGYKSKDLEVLRRGVGPEDLSLGVLDGINAQEVPGMLREERSELRQKWKKHENLVGTAVQKYIAKFGGAAEAKAAAIADGTAHEDDYDDDYEAVAARTRKEFEINHSSVDKTRETSQRGGDGSLHAAGAVRRRRLLQSVTTNVADPVLNTKKWFDKAAVFHHETPRPVVTYLSRNFFSRGILNEGDILAYILARYNVTLKVTTFEEPLHVVMDTLSKTDVMIGMHGAGWTNGLFIKRGATTIQMFPYGWRLPDNTTLRGYNYREIVLASECPYYEWVNPLRENAFFRRSDYPKATWDATYSIHPGPDTPLPTDGFPGNIWIYQNTYVDMNIFGPEIDALMTRAGIPPMSLD